MLWDMTKDVESGQGGPSSHAGWPHTDSDLPEPLMNPRNYFHTRWPAHLRFRKGDIVRRQAIHAQFQDPFFTNSSLN
jgi:hypothetical protein